jgi:PPK2 family polyphosphate:nucleotide phosphotransferase
VDPLVEPVASPYLVPFDGTFRLADVPTRAPDKGKKKDNVEALAALNARLQELQPKLYATNRHAVLLVFQAMDAAGKDGTIRAVLSGANPTGFQVFSFKAPSAEELDHDFLWRVWKALPERGRIGVFNRSHYEEVLTVRVNPKFLDAQRLPRVPELAALWQERYQSIVEAERHWARSGIVILKFWLNVSRAEQRERLLARIEEPDANWKFEPADLDVRARWDDYMAAYEAALAATSRPWAPWYAIPADSKSHMRVLVAEILVETLDRLDLRFPELSEEHKRVLPALEHKLKAERG